MNRFKGVVISLLVATIIIFGALLFWPFVLNDVIRPMAMAVWVLARILVLSIDQKYFWYAVAFSIVIF